MMFLSRVIAVGKHSASARKLAVFSIGTGLAGLASFYGGKEDVAEAKSASLLEWLKEVGVNRSYFEGGKNPLKKIYYGPVLHSLKFGEVTKVEKALLGVDDQGKIAFFLDTDAADVPFDLSLVENEVQDDITVVSLGRRFLIPGFVDGHAHAPQHAFTGTGLDLPLLQWLMKYTFPAESKFADVDHAREVYTKAVRSHLKNGSTTVSYFATIHVEASKELARIVEEMGQRAYVGKVNMDRNSPDFYIEGTQESLQGTLEFVEFIKSMNNPLVTPVITPRFVPSCTGALMHGLGLIARGFDLPIQSHMSEMVPECEWVHSLHPDCVNYSAVYDKYGLFTEKTYMAHCVHCDSAERNFVLNKGVGIVHCPLSNFSLASGICNVREWVEEGHKVGLGTDVSGGYSPSMLSAIRHARIASIEIARNQGHEGEKVMDKALTFDELFYLATLGGAQVLGLSDKIGNFDVGKEFDALVIDTEIEDGPIHAFKSDSVRGRFEKFLALGDDRNIVEVHVCGRQCL
jgi:guanine deaminase